MPPVKRFVIGLVLSTAAWAIAAPSQAQTREQKAGARAAAEAGGDAFDAGKYAEAADLFERAEQLMHAPPHLLYNARARVKLGQFLEAREIYLALAREALPGSAPRAFRDAQQAGEKELAEVEQRLAYVSVVVQGGAGARDLQVTRNGEPVSAALIGIPAPINPGEYSFRARADGMDSSPTTIKLREGARETVVLTLRAGPRAAKGANAANGQVSPAGDSLTSSPPRDDAPGGARPLLVASIASFGLAVVGGGLGTIFWLKSSETITKSDGLFSQCRQHAGGCSDEENSAILQLDSDAQSQRGIAIGGIVAGGVGLAAGVTLLVLDRNRGLAHAGPRFAPVVGLNHVGLIGRF
jgi:hypothetical protein